MMKPAKMFAEAAKQPKGMGDPKTTPRKGNPGPEKKAETNAAIDSAARAGSPLGAAKAELHAQHPQRYDDRGPHMKDAWMSRDKLK